MSRMSKVTKEESSIPVQSRISFMNLAKLHIYWSSEGHGIRTMSQLVSWSVDLLCEVLEANEKMPRQIETLAEAHNYLQALGLYQKSTHGRALKKIGTALKFDTMRNLGEDPKYAVPMQHKIMHGRTAVTPDNIVSAGGTSDEEWERIQEKIKEENEKDRAAFIKSAVKIARDSGLVVSEPEPEESKKYSQEEVRTKFFKEQAELKRLKGETIEEVKHSNVIPEPGPIVKEGMSDEEYEVKTKEIKEHDKDRVKLEKSAVINEENIVKE